MVLNVNGVENGVHERHLAELEALAGQRPPVQVRVDAQKQKEQRKQRRYRHQDSVHFVNL